MSAPTLSLCMIVKNEETYLAKCLQSVQAFVDEMIIVDTGSTDKTVEIANQFGAKIYSFTWINDFSSARNFSIQQATSDYILILDADEYFEQEVNLKQDLDFGHECYALRIKNDLGRAAHYHQALRIFKNNIGLKYKGKIHEHLNIEEFSNLRMAEARVTLHHIGYTNEVYKQRRKHERNFELLELEIRENPSGYNYYNLAKQYKANREYEKALDAYKTAFSKSKNHVYITFLLSSMADCLRLLKRYPEGIQLALDAIDSFPYYTELHFILGKLYEEFGYLEDALIAFRKCLELGDVDAAEIQAGVGSFLAHAKLGEIYLRQGKHMEAFEATFHAIQTEKGCEAAVELFLSVTRQKKIPHDVVYEQLKQVYPIDSGQDVLSLMTILFVCRHPLLSRLVDDFQLQLEEPVRVFVEQYAGRYEAARDLWLTIESIQEDKAFDLLLLATFLQDEKLLERCQPLLNMSHKEWKTLRKLVLGETRSEETLPVVVEKLALKLCIQAMIMQEFEVFERLSAWLIRGSVSHQLQLAEALKDYGYLEPAIDLLLQIQQRVPANATVYRLLGDICLQTNKLSDALAMYIRLLDLQTDFEAFHRIYTLYQQMQDEAGQQQVLREMRERFPLSQWVKQI